MVKCGLDVVGEEQSSPSLTPKGLYPNYISLSGPLSRMSSVHLREILHASINVRKVQNQLLCVLPEIYIVL